jgi:hypothetical protein
MRVYFGWTEGEVNMVDVDDNRQEEPRKFVPKDTGGFKVVVPEDILIQVNSIDGETIELRLNKQQQTALRKALDSKLGSK